MHKPFYDPSPAKVPTLTHRTHVPDVLDHWSSPLGPGAFAACGKAAHTARKGNARALPRQADSIKSVDLADREGLQ